MKATELRIGNWVNNGEQLDYVIDTSSMMDLMNEAQVNEGLTGLQPIPLTEEWLKRFNWNPPKDIGVSFSLTTDEIHFVAGNYYKKIEHVHQLQNLYFALTGEELNQNKEDEDK